MALRITEENGKLHLEGNINSVTAVFLKQHVQAIQGSGINIENSFHNPFDLWIE